MDGSTRTGLLSEKNLNKHDFHRTFHVALWKPGLSSSLSVLELYLNIHLAAGEAMNKDNSLQSTSRFLDTTI